VGQILERARRAIRNASIEDAIAELNADWAKIEHARALRAVRRNVGRTHQCGGCQRFLRAVNERCSCGFNNDIRGRRNVGGYA
jgi:bacterioferritin-associated ferredoxin